jgi:hypothetical protein
VEAATPPQMKPWKLVNYHWSVLDMRHERGAILPKTYVERRKGGKLLA